VVRLGGCAPFTRVPELLAHFTRVTISEATARRLTEGAGAAYEAIQEADRAEVERAAPEPAPGSAVQQLSVDGAMVPLRKGAWGEVKTLAIGEVVPDPAKPGEVRTGNLSYFSRRAEAEAFTRLAAVEVQRRGTELAEVVAGVVDGAAWCQGFLDAHCPTAVRILDFYHAVGYLADAAKAAFGAESVAATTWLAEQGHELKHGEPGPVLAALRELPTGAATDSAAAAAAQATALGYLEARLEQIQYAAFRARGLPIGSGAMESANKLVVEERLKGSGMHWAPAHVNPMVALRTVICSQRWGDEWPRIAAHLRRRARRRHPRPVAPPVGATPPPPSVCFLLLEEADAASDPGPSLRPKLVVNGKPTAAHPWKRYPAVARRASA
jgi:hypothetical protein